jgi:hypothetical protein
LDGANVLEAYQYVLDNAASISVLNMSYGSYSASPQEANLLQQIYNRGVVLVAAAGNESTNRPSYPADLPYVVKVSAVQRSGAPASFTNYGNIDLAAPGDDVLSTASTVPPSYFPESGTSFASPYVAAAVALVLSAGAPRHSAGDDEPEAVTILKDNADSRGRAVPDAYLGAGIVDLEAALRNLGGVRIAFVQPTLGAVVDTRIVRVQVVVRRVLNNNPANIRNVRLNGDPIPRSVWEPTAVVDADRKTITLDFTIALPGQGRHVITVEAIGQDGVAGSGFTRVVVQAHVQNAGLAMFSTPYTLSGTPEEVFGNDAILARYLPAEGTYARYSATSRDPRASFNPPGVGVRPENANNPTRRAGWATSCVLPHRLHRRQRAGGHQHLLLIPLQEGWNMIGNPFPFNVPWAACEVEVVGQGGVVQRLTLEEAARRDYIRLQIYRYLPLTGEYTWRTAPLGELIAWQRTGCACSSPARWSCRLWAACAAELTRRRASRPPCPDGWLLRLLARCGDREDANNFIGTASTASDELGNEDVEKPPAFQSYVALTILESRTRSALAQDLRRSARRTQRWDIEVATDQPNAEVTLQWNQELPVPKGCGWC